MNTGLHFKCKIPFTNVFLFIKTQLFPSVFLLSSRQVAMCTNSPASKACFILRILTVLSSLTWWDTSHPSESGCLPLLAGAMKDPTSNTPAGTPGHTSTYAFQWEFKAGTTSDISPPTQLPTGEHLRRFSFPLWSPFLSCALIQRLMFQPAPRTCSLSHHFKVTFSITFWLSDFWTGWVGRSEFYWYVISSLQCWRNTLAPAVSGETTCFAVWADRCPWWPLCCWECPASGHKVAQNCAPVLEVTEEPRLTKPWAVKSLCWRGKGPGTEMRQEWVVHWQEKQELFLEVVCLLDHHKNLRNWVLRSRYSDGVSCQSHPMKCKKIQRKGRTKAL